jgi:ABC-type transport system involved in multi-copper enzyme maturation permease subunit
MRILLTLVGKDFAILRRNRAALIFTFVVPMVVIYIVGLAFGLGRKDTGATGIPFAVVDESDNPAARKLVDALQEEKTFRLLTTFVEPGKPARPLTEADLRPMIRDRQFSYALVIPADFITDSRLGLRLKILSDSRNDIEDQMVSGILQKTIFLRMPQLLGQPAIDTVSHFVKIDREQVVGKDVKNPAATRIVGGYAVMFLLFALSSSAAAFFEEQNAGLFQRLLSSPVSKGQLLWGRFLYGVLFGLVQLVALFFAGHVLYGVDVFGHLGNLLIICASVAAACTAFGMLLPTITRSAAAASSLATLLVIAMSACGGAWFPVSFMPEFMQHIAKFTLVYWAIEGFSAVLWAGDSLWQLLPILGILLGTTAVVMILAVWRFNRSPIFE